MIWVGVLVIAVLLFVFPKQMGVLLSVLIVGTGIIALIDYTYSINREKEQESVSVVVSYAPDTCGKDSPLSFKITNGSKKIVNRVSWNIIATKKGYSSNIIDYESSPSYQNEYSVGYQKEGSTPYSTDKILKPKETFSVCNKVPLIKEKIPLQDLIWKVGKKYSEFQ
jgi:hypothetical protein